MVLLEIEVKCTSQKCTILAICKCQLNGLRHILSVCSCHHHPPTELSRLPKLNSVPIEHPIPTPPPAPGTAVDFLSLWICLQAPHVGGVIQCLSCCGQFISAPCPPGPSAVQGCQGPSLCGLCIHTKGYLASPPKAAVSSAQAREVQTPPEGPPCCFPQWLLLGLSAALSPLALGRFSGTSLSRERGSG